MFGLTKNTTRLVTSSFLFVALACCASFSNAQVSTKAIPANAFSPDGKTFVDDAYGKWSAIQEFVKEADAALKAKDMSSVDPRKVGPAYANAQQIVRLGIQLQYLREPSGVDLYNRGLPQTKIMDRAAVALRPTKGKTFAQKAEAELRSDMGRRQNTVGKVMQLLGKGEVAKAEQTFNSLLLDVDEYFVWLQPKSRAVIIKEFETVRRRLDADVKQMRAAHAIETLSSAIKENNPKIDKLIEMTEAAAKSVGSNGKAMLGGKEVEGPDVLKQLVTNWRVSHGNLIRCMGIQGLAGKKAELVVKPSEMIGTKIESETYQAAVSGLYGKMSPTLSKMITSDLNRPGVDQKALYLRYIGALGGLKGQVPDTFLNACEVELASLESGVGQLATTIKNYKKATNDVLLWRERAAASARRGAGDFLDVSSLSATLDKSPAIPSLTSGIDTAAPSLEPLIGKSGVAQDVHAISAKASFSEYGERAWATAMGEFDLSAETAELEKDLFISQGNPPMSLAAAIAIVTAKKKNVEAIGGEVASVQVEALGTRFPRLPASMNAMLPLNKYPDIGDEIKLDQMLLRYNLNPQWVQHKHFFKELK